MASSRLTWVIEPDLTKEVRVGGKKGGRKGGRQRIGNRKEKPEGRVRGAGKERGTGGERKGRREEGQE